MYYLVIFKWKEFVLSRSQMCIEVEETITKWPATPFEHPGYSELKSHPK